MMANATSSGGGGAGGGVVTVTDQSGAPVSATVVTAGSVGSMDVSSMPSGCTSATFTTSTVTMHSSTTVF